ncbi:MAG TPA: DUF881 domain-containing protein [Acidimicrobiales bacterium]|nr:DUF881 domain-containing protein [Acidimicrobiales bacterium]
MRGSRVRPALVVACLLLGFVVVVVARGRTPASGVRRPLTGLSGLIDQQQRTAADLRRQIDDLRRQIAAVQTAEASRATQVAALQSQLHSANLVAGLQALRGPAVRVTLNDSDLKTSPSGNVNDLVIHSQDIQAVVNALWRAGAEAIAVNDQRLVETSAVLCVGNTLLLNGTVHSPPYRVVAVAANRDRFEADDLVRNLRQDATTFGLGFSVSTDDAATVPAFDGGANLRYARPLG